MTSKLLPSLPSAHQAHPERILYLLDISSFIFRAYYAIRSLTNKKGEPTNAVYGVIQMVTRVFEEAHPQNLAIVYDSKEPSFRKLQYSEYKANRQAPPDDLIPQFGRIEEVLTALELPSFRQSGVEADDLIATLAHRWREADPLNSVVIVSGDKDLMQLVDDRCVLWETMGQKVYNFAGVQEKFGVLPSQIRDYLSMVGDSSDNIPGVAGIGPRGAVDLLKSFTTLDRILEAAREGKVTGKKGTSLVEGAAMAKLSQELVSLKDDLPVNASPEKLSAKLHPTPRFIEVLKELDFDSLVKKWSSLLSHEGENESVSVDAESDVLASEPPSEAAVSLVTAPEFQTVFTSAQLSAVLAQIEERREFGFDLETTSLNPREAQIVGVALCTGSQDAFYIPVGHRFSPQEQLGLSDVLTRLKPYLEDPRFKKIGQNLKYDWSVLIEHGVQPDGIGADTMVASYALDPEGRHNLDTLADRYLGYRVLKYEEVCGSGKDQIPFDQVPVDLATRYSAEDAWIAYELWNVLRPKLHESGLMRVFAEVDLPLVPVLARMELEGICVDVPYLKQLSVEFDREILALNEKIQAYAPAPVNLNSPKQLQVLLFEHLGLPATSKTKTGYSTDASVLESLSQVHEVPRLLLEYREIAKLKGTYVDPLPGLRDPKTGKIHTSFHQTVAATGRLSCSDPNLQNIPIRSERGLRIRRAFLASPGNLLISADYSQIELRLLAHLSGDEELCGSFQRDEDVHRRTASEIFGIPTESVGDRERAIAKAINFGLMYGKTPFGLAQELQISRKEAQHTIDRYFERYKGVKLFLDRQIQLAKEKGFSETLLGRKRPLPLIHSRNAGLRANAERMAMNAPIQGTAADLMKLAMIELDAQLREKGFRSKMILQVHDEVLLDCPKDEVEKVRALTEEVLENALTLSVPLRVNSAVGPNWMEL
jgi:DNA polymerase-1